MGVRIKFKTVEVKTPAPISDCWHICKSMMIVSLILGIIVADSPHWLHLFGLGVTWNVVFTLFYHKILYR